MKSVFTALILLLFLLSVNTVYAANVTTEQVLILLLWLNLIWKLIILFQVA